MSTDQSIEHRERETRQTRGEALRESAAFERISSDVYIIECPNGSVYTVNLERVTCECRDFDIHHHIPKFVCKHLWAVRLYAAWLRCNARQLAPFFGGEAA